MSNNLKIRCSSLGKVCNIDSATKVTDADIKKLKEYQLRKTGNFLSAKGKALPLTDEMQSDWNRISEKIDAPDELSKGAKTEIEKIFFESKSGFRKTFTSKYTDKGNINESKEIDQICKYLGLPLVVKNEKHFENDWIKGTPDAIFKPLNFQFDAKGVYYPEGLDTFDAKLDKDYEMQCHGYDFLLGVDNFLVVKILLNPPAEILQKEVWSYAKIAGIDIITDNFVQEIEDLFDFESKMKLEDRINIYHGTTTKEDIEFIKKCSNLANDYHNELEEIWKVKNNNSIEFVKVLLKR